MILSQTGVVADILWYEIPNHAPHVELGDFVVMPNHIHGILILDKPTVADTKNNGDNDIDPPTDTDIADPVDIGDIGDIVIVETLHATSLQYPTEQYPSEPPKNEQMADISPKSRSVSVVIRSYKSAVTKHANRLGLENGWQARFHDHIIPNDAEYRRISNYIIDNPANWNDDKFNVDK
jgi:REP element-mobilizing transposase RayT